MTAPGATSDPPATAPRPNVARAGATALWRDVASGAAADPGFAWALVIGVLLIGLGLLGFLPNPIVGAPTSTWGTPLLLTGDAHDVIHLVGGAVALHAALGMSRPHRDGTLIGLGAGALILLALGLLDGRWFGIAPWPVGLGDQLVHLIVGLGCLVMGLAGSGTVEVPLVTGAYRRAAARSAAAAAGTVASLETSEPATEDAARPGTQAEVDPAGGSDEASDAVDASDSGEPAEALPEPLGLVLDDEVPTAESAEPAAAAAEPSDPPVIAAEPVEPTESGPTPTEAAETVSPPDAPGDPRPTS